MRIIKEKVILVNRNNRKIGTEEKLKAHQEGKLHRAFSIIIFNSKEDILIQRRAKHKYHSGGLWTNACCSHPKPKEELEKSIHRKLKEEMGFDCRLKKTFCFTYKMKSNPGLIENEYDCVFTGKFDGIPKPNPKEVMDYKWISIGDLRKDVKERPEKYSVWLRIILKKTDYFKNKEVK